MGRRPRFHYPGALYHVISRGNRREKIFRSRGDFQRFVSVLREIKGQAGFTLYAYVLMPNHFHMLIEVAEKPLSKVMQSLLYRYTRYYNKRYHQVGHLFQGRYKAIVCDKESYLVELVRYLHLNPVRARMVRNPSDYPWSSHRAYVGDGDGVGVAVEEILSRWSKRKKHAGAAYEQFVLDGIEQGHREDYYRVKEQRYLGDEEFVDKVEKRVERVERVLPIRVTFEEIVERVGREYGKTAREILGRGRGRREAELRAIVCYVGREIGGLKLTQAARVFARDISALSMVVKKLEARMLKDEALRRRVQKLCASLAGEGRRKYSTTQA
ncbi:MAG: REP-associated tyrosine transposase [Candidatus Binatia bacterium]